MLCTSLVYFHFDLPTALRLQSTVPSSVHNPNSREFLPFTPGTKQSKIQATFVYKTRDSVLFSSNLSSLISQRSWLVTVPLQMPFWRRLMTSSHVAPRPPTLRLFTNASFQRLRMLWIYTVFYVEKKCSWRTGITPWITHGTTARLLLEQKRVSRFLLGGPEETTTLRQDRTCNQTLKGKHTTYQEITWSRRPGSNRQSPVADQNPEKRNSHRGASFEVHGPLWGNSKKKKNNQKSSL